MTREPYAHSTIEAYLERLASAQPEPGGGSASALVGALAAALLSMVANLTLGKDKYAGAQDMMAELKVNAEFARARLSELITLDAEAYAAVAQAMKLPKDAGEEERRRRATLQKALLVPPWCRSRWPKRLLRSLVFRCQPRRRGTRTPSPMQGSPRSLPTQPPTPRPSTSRSTWPGSMTRITPETPGAASRQCSRRPPD